MERERVNMDRMTHLTLTQIVMALAVVLLLAYDIYAVIIKGMTNTISWQVAHLAKAYPLIPFLLGMLAGHFFWNIT